MKIIADTNVILRAVLRDDAAQADRAIAALNAAESVAISVHCMCGFVWVLSRRYDVSRSEISGAIRRLIDTRNVVVDRPAVVAGLCCLDQGGDFADGVIAHDGRLLGGDIFVSFDRKAVARVGALGCTTRLL